jgi:hypothetical protein
VKYSRKEAHAKWIQAMAKSDKQVIRVRFSYRVGSNLRRYWWYDACDHKQDTPAQKKLLDAVHALPAHLENISKKMRDRVGHAFCAIHVRRGDKIRSCMWPHLKAETTGNAIMANTRVIRALREHRCKSLYLATDEVDKKVFHSLFAAAKWDIVSKWNFTAEFKALTNSEVVALEYAMLGNNHLTVRTFKTRGNLVYLSSDPKNGASCRKRKKRPQESSLPKKQLAETPFGRQEGSTVKIVEHKKSRVH